MDDREEEEIDTTQLMVWGIPSQIKRKFKAKCVEEGVAMRTIIIQLLEDYAENAGS